MSTLAEYLTLLAELRTELADNLTRMGVEAAGGEPLQTLVPKVLGIQQGDIRHECCDVALSALPCSYGFFAYDETAVLTGAVTVSAFYKMRTARLLLTGTGSLETLEVDAPGWTVTREENVVTLEADVTGLSGGQFSVLVDAVRLRQSAAADLTAAVTLEIIGDETGEVVGADGSAVLAFRNGSWEATEGFGLTWEEIEAREMTWAELESLGKP